MAEFNPDEYLKEAEEEFNPDAYLAEQTTEESLMQPIQSMVVQGADTLTGGYLPQIMGGVKSALTPMSYVDARDESIQMLADQENRDPLASGIGAGLGIAGQMAIPAGRIVKGIDKMSVPAKAAAQTAMNLGQVGLQNPGDVQGEINPLQLQERKKNLEDPVSLSLSLIPAATASVSNAMKKGLGWMDEAKAAFKAAQPTPKAFREALESTGQKDIKNLGKFMLDEKIVSATSNIDDIYFRSKEKLKTYGKELGSLYQKSAKKIEDHLAKVPKDAVEYLDKGLDVETKRGEILKEIDEVLKASPGKDAALKKADEYLTQIESEFGKGRVPDLIYLHEAKQKLSSEINFLKKNKELPDVQVAYKLLLKRVNDGIDNELNYFDKIVGGNESKALRDLNSKLTKLYVVNDMAARGFSKTETRGLGLASAIGASGGLGFGLSTGDPIKALAATATGAIAGPVVQTVAEGIGGIAPSTKATLFNKLNNNPQSRMMSAPLRGYLGTQVMDNQRIEEFPMQETIPITGDEVKAFEADINANSNLSNIQKSKRLNLIRKHGRVYIGQ